MVNAAKHDFEIEQGATFDYLLTLKDSSDVVIDLTGYTASMQIRKTERDSKVIKELTESSGITITALSGTLRLIISATDTTSFNFKTGVYDLKIDSGSKVTRILEGNITLDKQVTR